MRHLKTARDCCVRGGAGTESEASVSGESSAPIQTHWAQAPRRLGLPCTYAYAGAQDGGGKGSGRSGGSLSGSEKECVGASPFFLSKGRFNQASVCSHVDVVMEGERAYGIFVDPAGPEVFPRAP